MFLNVSQTKDCCDTTDALIDDYSIFLQSLLLIISNFFLLPAVYLSLRCRYIGESFIYFLTMLCSTFYHLCDNEKMNYCIFRYDVLQFCDFYSAILSLWVTAVLMSEVNPEWKTFCHLSGALFFAGLLRSHTTGVISFVVPGVCALLLLAIGWGYLWHYKKILPKCLSFYNIVPGVFLTVIGALLFASQVTKFGEFYGFTHSGWHICMSLAISFFMPKSLVNRISFKDYSDRICVLSSA